MAIYNIAADKAITAAAEAMEAGFTTKAAQKVALDKLSSAYRSIAESLKDRCLAAREGEDMEMPEAIEAVYWELPSNLSSWRAKHGDMVLKVFPDAKADVQTINRLFELRAKVNAAEIGVAAKPAKGEREASIRTSATGRVYAVEFGKLAPALAKDYEDLVEYQYARLRRIYGDRMTAALARRVYPGVRLPEGVKIEDVKAYGQIVAPFMASGSDTLDRQRLKRGAQAYAKQQIEQFVVKLTQKLGDLTDVAIHRVNGHRFECGIEGKLGGHRIRVEQTAKLVQNQHGTVFHQFPALIYVDGKFTTEAAYKRLAAAG